MDESLVKAIMEMEPPSTIYFTKMVRKTDKLDQYFYNVIGRYLVYTDKIEVMADKDKGDHFHTILLAWQQLLREPLDTEHDPNTTCFSDVDAFVQSFRQETKDLTIAEKTKVLYRLPWHLRILMIVSHGRLLNVIWIGNVISVDELDEFSFPEVGYFEVGWQDKEAIDVIADDIKEEHVAILKAALTKELPTVFQFAAILSQQIDDGKLDRSKLDELVGDDDDKTHAAAIIAYMFNKLAKGKRLDDFDEYVLVQTFFLCFWHFMLTETETTWVVKNRPFQFMKAHRWLKNVVSLKK